MGYLLTQASFWTTQKEKKSYELKKEPALVKSVELTDIVELLGGYRTLDVGEAVKNDNFVR